MGKESTGLSDNRTRAFIIAVILGVIGLAVRVPGFGHVGGDMVECLIPWYDSIAPVNGIYSLRNYTGNYGMPYVTILWLLHFIPGQVHIKIKAVSVIFEYVAAVAAGLLSSHFHEKKKDIAFLFGFALTLFYPPLILNGAVQGQCDGIYVAFVLLTVYALFKNRPVLAFILLGCAFAFKLQTIFILPFLILYYYKKRNFSVLHVLLVPITVEILYIPAMIAGYSPISPITAYIGQAGYYPQMYMYYPNLWCFFWRWAEYDIFNIPVIGWVITLYAFIFLVILGTKKEIKDHDWLQIALLTSFLAVYFMPAIHERYGLIPEILLIVYCVAHPRRSLMYVFVCSTQTWNLLQFFKFTRWPDGKMTAMGMLILLMVIAILTVRDISSNKDADTDQPNSFISKPEKVILEHADKYIFILVYLIAAAILVYTRKNFIRITAPDYLSDIMVTGIHPHTGLYMFFIKLLDLIGSVTGKETYFLLKISCLIFDVMAAGIWTYIISKKIRHSFDPSFALAYILVPSTALYSAIGGRPDGLCLMLTGIGYMLLSSEKPKNITAGLAFGAAIAISPAYILLIAGLVIQKGLINRSEMLKAPTLISASAVLLISPLSPFITQGTVMGYITAYILSLGINGSIIVPICTLMLICTYKNRNFLPALMALEYAALINFGMYMDILEKITG